MRWVIVNGLAAVFNLCELALWQHYTPASGWYWLPIVAGFIATGSGLAIAMYDWAEAHNSNDD